jgi:hypothetical protein
LVDQLVYQKRSKVNNCINFLLNFYNILKFYR